MGIQNRYLKATAPSTGGVAPIGQTLMKTGMVASNQTNDDAFNPQGRDNDFFNLGGVTPWGNNKRYSDELGNTSDGTNYYDSNGASISSSLAYVNEVFIDWSTFNGTTYLMYYFGEMSGTLRNFTDYLSWCDGLSILGHTDWMGMNENEMFNLRNPNRQGVTFYPPMSKKGVFGGSFWSNTSHKDTPTSAYAMSNYGGGINEQGKTNTFYCIAVRRGTPAEIGLIGTPSIPIGAKILKTGCLIPTPTGSDGDLQEGRDDSFLILPGNNPFGNTNRFTTLNGNPGTYNATEWLIDWTTFDGTTVEGYVNGWYNFSNMTWLSAITFCNSYSLDGFSGARLINKKEGENIMRSATINPFDYAPFLRGFGDIAWTSTSPITDYPYTLESDGRILYRDKNDLYKPIPIRTFTVNGTTLT